MEDAPGRHSTGRSAALFSEYFGSPVVRALTAASRRFLAAPPAGFARHALLSPRGVVTVALPGAEAGFEAALADARTVGATELSPRELAGLWPAIRPGRYARAMHKPAAMDLDVAAVHEGYLRGVRAGGGQVATRARVQAVRRDRAGWVDVRVRDVDVAIGLDRFTQATTLPVRRVAHAWAGLRTAPPDDVPVVGADPRPRRRCGSRCSAA